MLVELTLDKSAYNVSVFSETLNLSGNTSWLALKTAHTQQMPQSLSCCCGTAARRSAQLGPPVDAMLGLTTLVFVMAV